MLNSYSSTAQLAESGALTKITVRPERAIGIAIPVNCDPRIYRTISELESSSDHEAFVLKFSGLITTETVPSLHSYRARKY